MATQALATSHQEAGNRIANQAYEYSTLTMPDSATTAFLVAPCDGKLKRAVICAGGTAIDETNNYITVVLENKSNSDADLLAAVDTGDGTDTAAYANRVLVLDSTAANLAVDEGDHLLLTVTEQGSVGSDNVLLLVWEVA